MREQLTESFCERCGTRYTFRVEPARRDRLGGVVTLGRGIRRFLTTRASLERSLAAARADAERETSGHQLDAFHRTFRFCLGCGQYVCGACWDEAAARCRTCADGSDEPCWACGRPRSPRARFCRHCGATAGSPATAQGATSAAPAAGVGPRS